MPVKLVERGGRMVADRPRHAADVEAALGEATNPDWQPVALDGSSGRPAAPFGAAGFRRDERGEWTLEEKDGGGRQVRLRGTLADFNDEIVPAKRVTLVEGSTAASAAPTSRSPPAVPSSSRRSSASRSAAQRRSMPGTGSPRSI